MSGHYSPGKRSPKSFTLQGSNDDSNWTNLDVVSGLTGWSANEWRAFTIDSPGDYRSYRLKISEAADADAYLSIREFELLAPLELNTISPLTVSENQAIGALIGSISATISIPMTYEIPFVGKNNLVGWWKFDDPSSVQAIDSSGNGRNGNLYNGASKTSGKFGQALSLDGSDDYVLIPNYKGITGTNPRTMSAWIKTSKAAAPIFNWGSTGSSGRKWTFRIDDSGKIRIEVYGGSNVGSSLLTDNQWRHVVCVLESGNTNVNQMKLYVDGVRDTSSASSSRYIYTSYSQDLRIGLDHSSRKFQGKMDDLRLFDRGLSPDEITQLYGNGAGDTSESLAAELFQLEANGTLRTKKAFDFESDDQNYTLPVRIRHGLPSLTPITVSLTNIVEDLDGDGIEDPYDSDADGDGFSNQVELVNGSDPMDATSFNRAPSSLNAPAPLSVEENQAIGSIIGTFMGTDPDQNSTLRIELLRPTWGRSANRRCGQWGFLQLHLHLRSERLRKL